MALVVALQLLLAIPFGLRLVSPPIILLGIGMGLAPLLAAVANDLGVTPGSSYLAFDSVSQVRRTSNCSASTPLNRAPIPMFGWLYITVARAVNLESP